jgi:AcrR family transcriptional regulator
MYSKYVSASPSRTPRRPGRPAAIDHVEGREALLRATHELLAEQGPGGLTLRAVAERAGVRPTLVHYHFGSKEDLVGEALAQIAADVSAQIRSVASEGSTRTRLMGLVIWIVRFFAARPYLPRLVVEHLALPDGPAVERLARDVAGPNVRLLEDVIREGVASGELREVEPGFAVPAIVGTCAWFFTATPLVGRVFGLDASDPEVCDAFAHEAAEFVWNALRRVDVP